MQNLRNIRKEKKITQKQMAEDLGVSTRMVTKWEKDDYNYPSIKVLICIAKYLQVSPRHLIGSFEETRPIIINSKGQIDKNRTVVSVTNRLKSQALYDEAFNNQLSMIGHTRTERLIALAVEIVNCAYRLVKQIRFNKWEEIITRSKTDSDNTEHSMQQLSFILFDRYSGLMRSKELIVFYDEISEIIYDYSQNPLIPLMMDLRIGEYMSYIIDGSISYGARLTMWRAEECAVVIASNLLSYPNMQEKAAKLIR